LGTVALTLIADKCHTNHLSKLYYLRDSSNWTQDNTLIEQTNREADRRLF